MPDAASDIEGLVESRFLPEKGERRLNQVVDIDIVADGNAVSPDGDRLFAQGFSQGDGNEALPSVQVLPRAVGVRRAENQIPEALRAVHVTDALFHHLFGPAVMGDGGQGIFLGKRREGGTLPIDRAAGREIDQFDMALAADFHQSDGGCDNLFELLLEIREAATRDQGGDQMDNGFDILPDQDGFQQLRIRQIAPVQMDGKMPDLFNGCSGGFQDGNDVFSP